MLYEYILNLKFNSVLELLFQFTLFYNLIQILKQNNFYYMLAYFLTFILYLGIYFIAFDMDIACIILWILYGGVIIIFFVYSLMWFENIKNLNYFSIYKYIYYFFPTLLFIIYILFINTDLNYFNDLKILDYIDFYNFLAIDTYEELDNLGWGLIYYSTFFFLILSYMLFLTCCCSVVIIINSKKIKYLYLNMYYLFLKKNKQLFTFNIFKYQHFYTQDYENINQNYTYIKNFKINNNFHKIKNFNRRV